MSYNLQKGSHSGVALSNDNALKSQLQKLITGKNGKIKERINLVVSRRDATIFFKFILSIRSSEHTRRGYFYDILDFFEFLKTRSKKTIETVEREDVEKFTELLQYGNLNNKSIPLAASTIKRKLTAVSKFYRFLIRDKDYSKLVKFNPCTYVDRPKVPVDVLTDSVPKEIVVKLINAPDTETLWGLMHKTFMKLKFNTGARVEEIISLKIMDYSRGLGKITFTAGKSKKIIVKNLTKEMKELLDTYLDILDMRGFDMGPKMPIFRKVRIKDPSQSTGHLHQSSVWRFFKTHADKLQIEDLKIHPHVARAFFITEGSEFASEADMARSVGHKSTVMTNLYYKKRVNKSLEIASGIGV